MGINIKNSSTAFFEKTNQFSSTWRRVIVAFINIVIILYSLICAITIRFEFPIPHSYFEYFIRIATIFVAVKMFSNTIFKLNSGLWRYISLTDIITIIKSAIFSGILLSFIFFTWRKIICINFAMTIIVIDFLIWIFTMAAIRVCVRIIREADRQSATDSLISAVVVGNLEDIDSFLHGLKKYKTGRKIVAAFSQRKDKGGTIRGVKIQGSPLRIAKYVKKHDVKEIILIPPYSRKRFLNLLLQRLEKFSYPCSLKIVPSISDITKGEFSLSNIRDVNVEDLLGRPAVKFTHEETSELVAGKNIMVTGGGGSIGSELCRQLCRYKPKKLVVFEFSEYNLYEIERKLQKEFPEQQIEAVLGDIRLKNLLQNTIKKHSVNIIYHAAAYKHVPLLEKNVLMGLYTNIIGTANVAECAENGGVQRVVIISTDKAVRPTSIMGASKRIAERVILERQKRGTQFVAVRFGNVLGSRGSVIPLFEQQIKEGGPVTVTSKNMIRYFMSIPEAVELVLQAGTIGSDRDIMILDMGEQVNIYEMAKKLIELSGLVPHRDIKIKFTGLRPGEKEYEELLATEELVDRTSFPRICVARKQHYEAQSVELSKLKDILRSGDDKAFKNICKQYVPENLLS